AVAALIPFHAVSQIFRPVSVFVKNQVSAATRRPIPAMIQPITGIDLIPVEIARKTPLIARPIAERPPDAIHAEAPRTAKDPAAIESHVAFPEIHEPRSLSAPTIRSKPGSALSVTKPMTRVSVGRKRSPIFPLMFAH